MLRFLLCFLTVFTLYASASAQQAPFVRGKIEFDVTDAQQKKTALTTVFKPGMQVWMPGPFTGERFYRVLENYASMRQYRIADDDLSYSWKEIFVPATADEARKTYVELPVSKETKMMLGMPCQRFMLLNKTALPDSQVVAGWSTPRLKGPTMAFNTTADALIPGFPLEYQTGRLKGGVVVPDLSVKATGYSMQVPENLMQIPDTAGVFDRTKNSPFAIDSLGAWKVVRKTPRLLVLSNDQFPIVLELHRNALRSVEARKVIDYLVKTTDKKPEAPAQSIELHGKPAWRWTFPAQKTDSKKKGATPEKIGYLLFRGPEVWNHAYFTAPEFTFEAAEKAVLELLERVEVLY